MTVYVARKTESINTVRISIWYKPEGDDRTQIERWGIPNAEAHLLIDRVIENIRATFGPIQIVSY